jgi:methyl-accepting chemotaxis protein
MFFTPNEDVLNLKNDDGNEIFEKELLDEIGEISRDFALTSTQLDKITDHLLSVVDRQNELTNILLNIAKTNADIINPNPQMLEIMGKTNESLKEFKDNIIELNRTTNQLKQEEIRIIVRREIVNFFANRID